MEEFHIPNFKFRVRNIESGTPHLRLRIPHLRPILLASIASALLGAGVLAAPTQEEVFKSISNSVDSSVDPRAMIAMGAVVAGVILILAIVKLRGQREVNPRAMNHPGKLMKEIARRVSLKPGEVKQLKLLAEPQDVNPLTLILCPSLLAKSVKSNPAKLDRAVVAGLVRKVTTRPQQAADTGAFRLHS